MFTRYADRSRVSALVVCLSLAGVVACASEGDDPLGGRGGAATNNPTFDLRAVSPALSPTIVEGGSFAWSVNVSNTGTTRFESRSNPAVVRLQVSGNGNGTFSAGTGCESFEPNVWLCQIVSLPVGDTRGYAINVIAGTVGTITVTATVSPLEDADPSNNTTTQVVQVTGLEPCPEPSPCEEFTHNPRKRCEVTFKPAGTVCEQVGCLAGVCDGKGGCADLASKCEAGDCTTSTCDAATNTCVSANKPDGQVCASSSQCGGNGRCEAGVCNSSDTVVCNDDNPCTVDLCQMGENRRYTCQNVVKSCPGYGSCGDGICDPQTGACEVTVDHARCDDGLACTDDVCTSNGCTNVPKHDRCSDSNLCDALLPVCDEDLGCIETACRPRIHGDCEAVQPKSCDDGNACTTDSCNPATGQCANVATVCNDNNACTVDACNPATGVCSSTAVSCDDGNACTIDSCDPVSGQCRHTPKNCDDGVACTADSCVDGVCVNAPRNSDCSDGNACNGAEVCEPGQGCRPGTPVQCDDGNACTTDSCNPTTGACTHTAKSCDDGNACTADSCDTTTGQCPDSPLRCDDGNRCNGAETCDPAHGCRAGTPVTCDDGNACTIDSCDSATGECRNVAKSCDDGNACTIDSCDLATGQCRNVAKSCDDGVACTVDSCVDGACVHTTRNDLCSDGDLCNGVEVCDATQGCKTGEPLNCDDGIACTADSCVNGACVNTPVPSLCSDGNVCNGAETCDATRGCVAGNPLVCDDGNVCTTDSCDPVRGCVAVNNTNPCDDGNACNNACLDWDIEPAAAWTVTNYQGGNHGFWLPGFNGGNGVAYLALQSDTKLAWWDDGTAVLAGTAEVTQSAGNLGLGDRYAIEIYLTYRGVGPAGEGNDGPKLSDLVDYEDTFGWQYFDLTSGFLFGLDDTSDFVSFEQYPENSTMPFQLGVGANDKTLGFGAATWLTFERSYAGGVSAGVGDLNVDLQVYECPTQDMCVDGACVGRGPVVCDDGDQCTTESCDPNEGCVSQPYTGPCNDGNACTTNDTCGGTCSGTPVVCDDDNACTTDTCDPSAGCIFIPIPDCGGDCPICTGVSRVTLGVTAWSGSRDQNEVVRVRQNTANGTVLYSGVVGNGGSFEVNVPLGTNSIVVTVQGNQHASESVKASFQIDCATAVGQVSNNGYVTFKVVDVKQRVIADDCDDGDECTSDECTPTGCVSTPIPGCGLCPECVGVQRVTVKVTAWAGNRDTNETVRIRKNSANGAILWSGKIANNGSVNVDLPTDTSKIVLTVQGNSHANESEKAQFTTNCALAINASNGNSYITFKVTGLVQRTRGVSCDDNDPCTADECTATGCVNTPIPYCGMCPECVGVQRVTVKVSAWAGNRDTNETVRIRKNGSNGTKLFEGKIANNGSVTIDLPADTTSIVLTVKGNSHSTETQKAAFTTNCALSTGKTDGNSYIKFTITNVVQRTEGVSCDDGDACTTDQCSANGCTHTEIAGCRLCTVCEGVSRVTAKVTSWYGTRDQNETVRIRKNGKTGTILWSGKIANNGSVTLDVPTGTTKLVFTVQGNYHASETEKASFNANCALGNGAVNGNSYIKFTLTNVTKRTTQGPCN